jgi:hypothetical protein
MSRMARIYYVNQSLSRSCLESSPARSELKPFSTFGTTRPSDRAQSQLHQLKRKLLRAALEATPETGSYKRLCGAANQAAELAWTTPCPLLVFPCLFEEMVETVRAPFQQDQRQSDEQPSVAVMDGDAGFEGVQPASDRTDPVAVAGLLLALPMPQENG